MPNHPISKAWRTNIDRYKANGSKVSNRARAEIIRPKRSWWIDESFREPASGLPALELARMRHNTQGTMVAADSF